MKLLAVTSDPITADQLRAAVSADTDPAATEILVLAPALPDSALRFWLSDVDAAIERAVDVRTESVRALAQEGLTAAGRTGASDPLQAIADALVTFPADRIVIFAHRKGDELRYGEDIAEEAVRERFGLPVDRAELP